MATLATPIQFARSITGSNSSSLTDSNAIIWATDGLLEYRRTLIKWGAAVGQTQESYMTPLAGVGQYNYNSSPQQWILKSVEINYNSTNQQDYKPAGKADTSNTPQSLSFDWLRVNQPANVPLYNDSGSFFEVFPTAQSNMNLVNAFKMIFYVQPTPYAATTDTLAFPESTDPNVIGYWIAAAYQRSLQRFDAADKLEAKGVLKAKEQSALWAVQGQQPVMPASIPWTGSTF